MPIHHVRLKYEAAVIGLGEASARMLGSGASEEHVARWAASQRNALKQEYRDLTPTSVAARIAAKTLARYGNAIGPSAQELHAAGKSWREIIDSATRPGDHDADFFLL